MIYTVTFNPAIDYVVFLDTLRSGEINRTAREAVQFGGKGINVSVMLSRLGVRSTALGFAAGFTGEAIVNYLESCGVQCDFIRLKESITRINIKIKGDEETEINGQGPDIDALAIAKLFEKLDKLTADDTLILAGSIPNTLPKDIYEQILDRYQDRKVRFVVDASKELLVNCVKYRPFLIKPNHIELGEIFGKVLTSDEEIVECAKVLWQEGAQNVLVSMAGDGVILLDETGKVHKIGVLSGKVINSVGAGDSMVAGFIAGADKGYEYALKLGTACGGATAFSEGLGESEQIDTLFEQL